MTTNFYAILGVEKTATQAEIKSAYLRLSRVLHPDVNPEGGELMRLVIEAYEVIGDAKKRAAYDRGEKVKEFVNPAQSNTPGMSGTIDLTKLAQAFVPPHIYQAAGPSLERALEDRGITPRAAKVEDIFQAFGLLKKKRSRKSA